MASPSSCSASYITYLPKSTVIDTEVSLTREQLLEEDDLDVLFDYAADLNINLRGLNDLEEIRGRILLHLDTAENTDDFIEMMLLALENTVSDDAKKRRNLIELLARCIKTFKEFEVKGLSQSGHETQEGSHTIASLLKKEGKVKDLIGDFNKRSQQLKNKEFIIVISGETGAGKSSFLNLILGVEERAILPEHHNPCTSTITRLSYGNKPSVRVIRNDMSNELLDIDPNKTIREQVENILFQKDEEQREKGHNIKEVQIKYPLHQLKSGLVLMDSPGIGENDAMDSVIEEFVASNQIMGFIYLIKSDQPGGGIQEDKIGKLLKLIVTEEKKKSESSNMTFDPKSAIFVCNHWDLVKPDDREVIYKNIVKRLQVYWPGITEDQVLRFSTKKARQEITINRKYIIPEYKDIWMSLEKIVSSSLNRHVYSTYRWMETILKRMTQHLKTLVNRIDTSDDDLIGKLDHIKYKLQLLQEKSHVVLQDLKDSTNEASEMIYTQFKEYLSSQQAKTRIVNWTTEEIPDPESVTSWQLTKTILYQYTSDRVSKELSMWEEDNEVVKRLRDQLLSDIICELQLLEGDIKTIDLDLQADNGLSSSHPEEDLAATMSRRSSKAGHSLSAFTQAAMGGDMPIGFVAQYLSPLGQVIGISTDKNRLKEYKRSTRKVAKEKSERFLQYILNTHQGNCHLRSFIDSLLEGPRDLIRRTEEEIPSLVESNRDLMDHIYRCKRQTKESRSVYEKMMEGVELLKKQLMEYGKGEIFVNDFKAMDVKLLDPTDKSGNKTRKVSDFFENESTESTTLTHESRGLWTVMENGLLKKTDQIYVRMYLMSAKMENTYSEVSKLRFLDHKHVAEFLGIHHTPEGSIPAFIYRDGDTGRMKTLYKFFKSSKPMEDVVPRIVTEVVLGLEYLHRRNLVHMELNIYTITVDGSGSVKLTGACLPRKATLPLDTESIQASFFVYLSPDVLNGEIYLAFDDVYSLSLLIYELYLGIKPFVEQREWKLDQFINKQNPYDMLDLGSSLQHLDPELRDLIIRGLDPRIDSRPRIEDIYTTLSNMGKTRSIPMSDGSQRQRRGSQYKRT